MHVVYFVHLQTFTLVTTAPVAILAPSPMVTPGTTVAFAPIYTFLSKDIGAVVNFNTSYETLCIKEVISDPPVLRCLRSVEQLIREN
ncbi:hypothetical protein [Metabacillus endolithicus]|uniref:hypothetical protein n=1 Tax=Metabacillus endolithicus TaxID=1535204 RepID=UPI0031E6491A